MMKYDDKIFFFMYVLKRTTAVMEHLLYHRRHSSEFKGLKITMNT